MTSKYKVAPGTPEASVSLPVGVVPGTVLDGGVAQYLGVPYAEPPVDTREAAFEPPRPVTMLRPEWKAGEREQDDPYVVDPLVQCASGLLCCCTCGDFCCVACCWCCNRTKAETGDGKGLGLDVLRMNIWVPPAAKEVKVPVVVFIHGGGDCGSGKMSNPNSRAGSRLAAAQGVVVCVIDFRQGIFGTMDWGSGSDVPTNLELQDMVAALAWVQENIAAFGGDKSCVTIAGESIGGRRICELVWCPAAKGLFHRAVASSPSSADLCNLTPCVVARALSQMRHPRRLVSSLSSSLPSSLSSSLASECARVSLFLTAGRTPPTGASW